MELRLLRLRVPSVTSSPKFGSCSRHSDMHVAPVKVHRFRALLLLNRLQRGHRSSRALPVALPQRGTPLMSKLAQTTMSSSNVQPYAAAKSRSIKAATPVPKQQANLTTSAGGETATFLQFVRLYVACHASNTPPRKSHPLSLRSADARMCLPVHLPSLSQARFQARGGAAHAHAGRPARGGRRPATRRCARPTGWRGTGRHSAHGLGRGSAPQPAAPIGLFRWI